MNETNELFPEEYIEECVDNMETVFQEIAQKKSDLLMEDPKFIKQTKRYAEDRTEKFHDPMKGDDGRQYLYFQTYSNAEARAHAQNVEIEMDSMKEGLRDLLRGWTKRPNPDSFIEDSPTSIERVSVRPNEFLTPGMRRWLQDKGYDPLRGRVRVRQ